MEIIDKTIDARKEKEFNIIPIGDLHFGSLAFDNNLWNNFLKEIKNIKNPLFIITGDITDEDRPSTRDRRSDMFRDRIEAYIQEDIDYVDKLYKKLVPKLNFLNKNNCVGILDGDHYRVLNDGRTSAEIIAMALGVPYLGNGQAIARLKFVFRHTSRVFNIHIRHGKEFSYLVGTKINNNKRFVDCWEGIDLFVKGHSHSAWEEPISRFIFTKEGFLYTKQIFTINCCSFRETFVIKSKIDDRVNELKKKIERLKYQGERIPHELMKKAIVNIHKDTDYPEKREYPPVNNDLITFNIRFIKSRKEKGYPDYLMKTEIKRIPLA